MKKSEESTKGIAWFAMGITILTGLTIISCTTLVDVGFDLSTILSIVAVGLIGLFMTVLGVYYLAYAINILKYGKECYGIVENIKELPSHDDGAPDYLLTFLIINPDTSKFETYKKIRAHNKENYSVGSYILCKYYKKNIDMIEPIKNNEVPLSVREKFESTPADSKRKIELSYDREYITIDNIKYKRI